MTVFREGDLQITINGALNARKFDGDEHQLSHCMKAVDFIVELPDLYFYIEIKDPQHPAAPVEISEKYAQSFKSGEIDEELKYKYRDSLLYEWACGRADKPVYFLVLIALDILTATELQARTHQLNRKLPLDIPNSVSWPRPIVHGCGVFTIESWNETFEMYPVRRIS